MAPLGRCLEVLDTRLEAAEQREEPIFVFAAGWRSGSTLLQRLIMSSGEALIWGEPYADAAFIPRLTASMRAFRPGWPAHRVVDDGESLDPRQLSGRFVANLYPPLGDMVDAHRQFLLTLLRDPARRQGLSRWGLKDVSLGSDEAEYLHFLFRRARFLFIYRNPYDTWASFRRTYYGSYQRWPDVPVLDPGRFGRMWADLVYGFQVAEQRVGGLLVAYEDLCGVPAVVDRVEEYVNLSLDRQVLDERITGPVWARRRALSRVERRLLTKHVDEVASELGYAPPG